LFLARWLVLGSGFSHKDVLYCIVLISIATTSLRRNALTLPPAWVLLHLVLGLYLACTIVTSILPAPCYGSSSLHCWLVAYRTCCPKMIKCSASAKSCGRIKDGVVRTLEAELLGCKQHALKRVRCWQQLLHTGALERMVYD
jgi:hypothetical protein